MRQKKERSDNRRALPKFLLGLLGAALGGGVLGFFTGIGAHLELGESLSGWVNGLVAAVTPWAIPATTAVTMGTALALYRSARRQCLEWNGEDEDAMDRAEEKLSWVLLLAGVQMMLGMFFFAAASRYLRSDGVMAALAEFLISCGLAVFAQQKAVDLTKRMNPEKQGSIYDAKFHKKWMESCDEAERQQIGQAAIRAFRAACNACVWIWVALMMLGFVCDIGVLPVFVAMLLWGILQVTYTLECIRLSRKHA